MTEQTQLVNTTENALEKQMDETGFVDVSSVTNPMKRLEQLDRIFPPDKFNRIHFEEFLMMPIDNGVKFFPYIIRFTEEDMWDEDNTANIKVGSDNKKVKSGGLKLKTGYCEPSAEAIDRLASALGATTELIKQDEIMLAGISHIECVYKGWFMLPDGTIKERVGSKALPMLTNSGGLQAHVLENCKKKALRNCQKNLLGLKTAMPKKEFLEKIWLIMKPVFSEGTPQYESIEAKANEAKASLYPASKTIEVKPEPTPDPVDISILEKEIKNTQNKSELDLIINRIKQMALPEEHNTVLRKTVLAQSKFLKEVAQQEQAGF